MAFFLESTFVGLFFFGWDRLGKVQHLMVTFLVALGSNLSALWILIANAWMQNPVGAEFNYHSMRMELTSIGQIIFNPVAQAKFVHTVAAGYVTAATFVLGVSSYYLLRGRDTAFALRSFAIASGFGLASALSVIVLGDESGYTTGETQKVKLAVIEAEWHTQKPPASFMLFGIPNEEKETSDYAIHVPWLLGLIATRSVDTPVLGIIDLREQAKKRIENGIVAYGALQRLRANANDGAAKTAFESTKQDLGYGLLLKRFAPNVVDATPAQIDQAARFTIPRVTQLFWSFRIMITIGMWLLFLFAASFYFLARRNVAPQRWLMRFALWSIPLPWIAAELGWIVAEYGRQPWIISEVLPTFMGASTLSASDVWTSLAGFVGFYTALFVAEMYLMFKYARLGPSSLGTGAYHFERIA
jgi:cytochrome d ubiquinol oxidase subunit I